MKRMLAISLDMVIYTEGTRNLTKDPLKKLYDCAFRLAADTKKPVLPAVLFHTQKALPANKFFYLFPHKLEMHFLPAIESKEISVEELKTTAFNRMWDYYLLNDHQ